MQTLKTFVAVNKDPRGPDLSDFGVACDLHTVLPARDRGDHV
jgi:electron transfer flavoprotein alpha subunit